MLLVLTVALLCSLLRGLMKMSNTRWKLVHMPEQMCPEGWTVGATYNVNYDGQLIDDDGSERLQASKYNRHYDCVVFKPIPRYIENK